MSNDRYDAVQREKARLWAGSSKRAFEKADPAKRLVAEGDSWFDYPFNHDILDHLIEQNDYRIARVSHPGDTLEDMVYGTTLGRDYSRAKPQLEETTLPTIEKYKPRVVLFSGGGNDIAGEELERFLNHKDSGLEVLRRDYVDYMFFTVFKQSYRDLLKRIWRVDPTIHIIAHGYAYAIPDGRGCINLPGFTFIGPWLRPALCKKGVTDPVEGAAIIRALIDTFNVMLAQLQEENQNLFHHLDLRKLVNGDPDWDNELHLSDEAYGRVAAHFHAEIQRALTQSVPPPDAR